MSRALVILLASLLASPALAGNPNGSSSNNWAGFAQQSGTYTSVSAEWRVPVVSLSPVGVDGAATLQWIGIGGVGGFNQLIQTGTGVKLQGDGSLDVFPWYELIPAALVRVAQTVKTGDLMTATMTCATNCTSNAAGQTWNWTLQDITQGWTDTHTGVAYVSHLESAEIILEAPGYGGGVNHVLNRFQDVPFTNILVNGANPNLQNSQEFYLAGYMGDTANPSDATASGDGFKVCYGKSSTYTACPNTPTLANDTGRLAGF